MYGNKGYRDNKNKYNCFRNVIRYISKSYFDNEISQRTYRYTNTNNRCRDHSFKPMEYSEIILSNYEPRLFSEYVLNQKGIQLLEDDKLEKIIATKDFENILYNFYQDRINEKTYITSEELHKYFYFYGEDYYFCGEDYYRPHFITNYDNDIYKIYNMSYFDSKKMYDYIDILLISLLYDKTELLEYIINLDDEYLDPILIMSNFALLAPNESYSYAEYSVTMTYGWQDLYYDIAIRENKLNIVKFIHKNANKNKRIKKNCVEINVNIKEKIILACINNNLEIAQYLYEHYKVPITYEYFEAISKSNNTEIYLWLTEISDKKYVLTEKHFMEACISNHFEMIELLWNDQNNYDFLYNEVFLFKLIDRGYWSMIKYIFMEKLYRIKEFITKILPLINNFYELKEGDYYTKNEVDDFFNKYRDKNYYYSDTPFRYEWSHRSGYDSLPDIIMSIEDKKIINLCKSLNSDNIDYSLRSRMILHRKYTRINILGKSS
jgi:hypothetical protein